MRQAEPPIGFGLMCKPPRPGTSKTRLASGVGFEMAAQLSAAFLMDCAAVVHEAGGRTNLDCAAFYRPADAADELAGLLGPDWPIAFADAGDLGATMRMILADLLARCPSGAMIMGADVPMISADVIVQAARTLRDGRDTSVVIAPTADGGYCLIGVRSISGLPALFDRMSWSTPHVFDDTLQRAHAMQLDVTVLETQRDIDDADDLRWLRREIEQHSSRGPATRKVLSRPSLSH